MERKTQKTGISGWLAFRRFPVAVTGLIGLALLLAAIWIQQISFEHLRAKKLALSLSEVSDITSIFRDGFSEISVDEIFATLVNFEEIQQLEETSSLDEYQVLMALQLD